jgi:hypothetical protein
VRKNPTQLGIEPSIYATVGSCTNQLGYRQLPINRCLSTITWVWQNPKQREVGKDKKTASRRSFLLFVFVVLKNNTGNNVKTFLDEEITTKEKGNTEL